MYYACFHESLGDKNVLTAGLAWADDIKDLGGKIIATVGMAFLPQFQNHNLPMEFCHMCVDDAFTNLGASMLYGYTPLPNIAALNFIRKAGFFPMVDLPLYTTFAGEPCGVRISVINKP